MSADLVRIAAQVRPEDRRISWMHLRPVYMRERPVAVLESPRGDDYSFQLAAEELKNIESQGPQMTPAELKKKLGSVQKAYKVCPRIPT